MPTTYNGLLIRDSLSDTGTVPSPGYPYYSPDIICTQQNTYANPGTQFGSAASYASDPNLPVVGQQNNNFYVRAQNLGTATQGGTMYVYWCKASLFMVPGLWFNQPLTWLPAGSSPQTGLPLPPVAALGITVGATPFNWTPPSLSANDHFCLIGAVNTVPPYVWPPSSAPTFPNYDAFVLWVRNNQNLCWRNLNLISNPTIPFWDRLDSFSNPFSTDAPLLVSAQCTGVPIGTTIQLICTALFGTQSTTITTPNQILYAPGVTCPAGFSGFIETTAVLPNGMSWPAGARITTTPYVGMTTSSPAALFAHDFGADEQHPSVVAAKALVSKTTLSVTGGVLVPVGYTATAYQPQF